MDTGSQPVEVAQDEHHNRYLGGAGVEVLGRLVEQRIRDRREAGEMVDRRGYCTVVSPRWAPGNVGGGPRSNTIAAERW
jgi:hypothetical protein